MIERLKVEPMILCKDCRHHSKRDTMDICMANAEIEPVYGQLYSNDLCITERDPRKRCRPEGLNFVPLQQPKPPLGKVLTKPKK